MVETGLTAAQQSDRLEDHPPQLRCFECSQLLSESFVQDLWSAGKKKCPHPECGALIEVRQRRVRQSIRFDIKEALRSLSFENPDPPQQST